MPPVAKVPSHLEKKTEITELHPEELSCRHRLYLSTKDPGAGCAGQQRENASGQLPRFRSKVGLQTFESDLEGTRRTAGWAPGDLWLQLLLRLQAQSKDIYLQKPVALMVQSLTPRC